MSSCDANLFKMYLKIKRGELRARKEEEEHTELAYEATLLCEEAFVSLKEQIQSNGRMARARNPH